MTTPKQQGTPNEDKMSEAQMLEVHQGNAWRSLIFEIERLPISEEQKKELEESAFLYGEAVLAYSVLKQEKIVSISFQDSSIYVVLDNGEVWKGSGGSDFPSDDWINVTRLFTPYKKSK